MGHAGKLPTKVRKYFLGWQYSLGTGGRLCRGQESGISKGQGSFQEAGKGCWQGPGVFVLGRFH